MSGERSVPSAAAVTLDRWIDECATNDPALPSECSFVQGRLVRAVGRGELPELGPVFVKVMRFPRFRDRLRYSLRTLPGLHEGELLDWLGERAPELRSPEVVAAVGRREFGCPRLSVLVTRALPVADPAEPPSMDRRVRIAARLAQLGLFHPDLNAGNFLPLDDGATALIDLQSARLLRAPLGAGARFRMAAKLWSEGGESADPQLLVERGLLSAAQLPELNESIRRLELDALRRRVGRCRQESSEFRVRRSLSGIEYRRRAAAASAVRLSRPDAARLWSGDRVRELFDGADPLLAAMSRPWLSWSGGGRVELVEGLEPARFEAGIPELLERAAWLQDRLAKG